MQACARKRLRFDAERGDVLAERSRPDSESGPIRVREHFLVQQTYLAQFGPLGSRATREQCCTVAPATASP